MFLLGYLKMLIARQSQSILELEEEVQRDITNARKWFELGVKHQENERENKAIQALKRAVELDPSFLDAWLALAMSFSNEGQRVEAYGAIEKWVESNQRYADVVKGLKPGSPGGKRDALVDSLVAMIRSVDGGQVDADTQVALAVVLHTSEVRSNLGNLASPVLNEIRTIQRHTTASERLLRPGHT